jgi:hypothetical protein
MSAIAAVSRKIKGYAGATHGYAARIAAYA